MSDEPAGTVSIDSMLPARFVGGPHDGKIMQPRREPGRPGRIVFPGPGGDVVYLARRGSKFTIYDFEGIRG